MGCVCLSKDNKNGSWLSQHDSCHEAFSQRLNRATRGCHGENIEKASGGAFDSHHALYAEYDQEYSCK